MKKFTILILMTMMLGLSGCGTNAPETETGAAVSTEVSAPAADGQQTDREETSAEASVAPSYEAATVHYQGEAFIKSVFAAGGDMLYLCGIKADGTYFLGCMKEEEDVFREFELPMDGMRAINMKVDSQGNCHILWMSTEQTTLNGQTFDRISYEKSCITVVNRDGEQEREIDVTDVLASGSAMPYCFAVDNAGNYYLENRNTLIQIPGDGTSWQEIACDGEIEGVGTGASGAVYCVYTDANRDKILAQLEKEHLVSCGITLPDADATYSGVYPGADTELLLFSKSNGLYAYDGTELRECVPAAEMPVTGEDIAGWGVMSDGRLCILAQDGANTDFYYIPTAGKGK